MILSVVLELHRSIAVLVPLDNHDITKNQTSDYKHIAIQVQPAVASPVGPGTLD